MHAVVQILGLHSAASKLQTDMVWWAGRWRAGGRRAGWFFSYSKHQLEIQPNGAQPIKQSWLIYLTCIMYNMYQRPLRMFNHCVSYCFVVVEEDSRMDQWENTRLCAGSTHGSCSVIVVNCNSFVMSDVFWKDYNFSTCQSG